MASKGKKGSKAFVNLDCMDSDELRKFAITMDRLADYARCKARAIELRKRGQIDTAMKLEEDCESLYQRIPKKYRW